MNGTRQVPAENAPGSATEDTIADFGALVSELARRWSGRRMQALNGYRDILGAYATGGADARATASAVARLTASEVARYPGELVDLATDYASGLARMVGRANPRAAPGTQRAVHDLYLSGKLGEIATTALVIENPRDCEVTLGITAAAFANDARIIKLVPGFDPASFTLAPGAEQTITVSAKLDGRVVKPGESFTAQAIVDGFDDLVLRIHLGVEAA